MDKKLTNLLFAFFPQELIIVARLQRKAFDIVSSIQLVHTVNRYSS